MSTRSDTIEERLKNFQPHYDPLDKLFELIMSKVEGTLTRSLVRNTLNDNKENIRKWIRKEKMILLRYLQEI